MNKQKNEQIENNFFKYTTAARKIIQMICHSLCNMWPSLEENMFLITFICFFCLFYVNIILNT